jgi:hypothetical protein
MNNFIMVNVRFAGGRAMLGRALPLACLLALTGAWPAAAQFGPPGAPGGGQMPPCFNEFMPLRQEAEKRAAAVRDAGAKQKMTPQQACQLIGRFSEAEAKVVKYAVTNGATCGIPADAIKQMKTNHQHTTEIQKRACDAAAAPPRPTGPTLSDALNSVTKVPTQEDVKPGRGTFDTLTGNALGK